MEGRRLSDAASEHWNFGDLCCCSETWRRSHVDNAPQEPATYEAISQLCKQVLEPVLARFGHLELTYGFAGPALTRLIQRGIAPKLDQHAGHERRNGALICPRLGQAADLRVSGVPTSAVARFIAEATPFDRLYFYGDERPLHVSYGPDHSRALTAITKVGGRPMPRRLSAKGL